MNSRSGQLAAAAVLLLAPAFVGGVALLVGGDVPDPLPTHWNLAGEVDGTTSRRAFTVAVAVVVGFATVTGLVLVATARRGPARRTGAAATAWLAWLAAVLHAITLAAASGADSATGVDLPLAIALPGMLAPLGAAALIHRLLPRGGREHVPGPVPTSGLDLADGERVVWVGRATSRGALAVGVVLALLALPLWFAVWPAAVAATIAAIAVGWIHQITVRVDDAHLTVSWGPALWPRIRVALVDVAGASVQEIEPLRWGGWGYRRTVRGRAAVVRRGPGVVLELRDGQRFAVTVDEPAPAADLVNAVLVRSAR